MEDIKPELTELVRGEDFFEKILIVESEFYAAELCRRFPTAEIFFVAPDEDAAEKLPARVKFFALDYREERLPFPEEFFDLIIGDLTLEVVVNPQDIAAGFSTYLKQTGVWLTSFRNIRHWKILQKLMQGKFGGIVSRLYAQIEFERLLYASFYKFVKMFPQKKSAPPELLERLTECGFDNFGDDLEVEFWLVRAARSMPELSLLKSVFTPEIRARLSRILHRIEYDVEPAASVNLFWQLCDAEGIFPEYSAAFIRSVVVHRENFYKNLRENSERPEVEEIISETESLYDLDPPAGLLK